MDMDCTSDSDDDVPPALDSSAAPPSPPPQTPTRSPKSAAKEWSKGIIQQALKQMEEEDAMATRNPENGDLRFPGPDGAAKYAGGVCLRSHVAGWEARVHGRRVGIGRTPVEVGLLLVKHCRANHHKRPAGHMPYVRNVMRWSGPSRAWIMTLDSPKKGAESRENQMMVPNNPNALSRADSRICREHRPHKK